MATAAKTHRPVPRTTRSKPGSYMARPGELVQKWWLADADGQVVGRMASQLAMILMGKHRATYTPHVDTGDFVVVINAEKIVFTGKKWQLKEYKWYTGYTRLRSEKAGDRLARRPELIIREAVRRMLPKNKLAVHMLAKLKIYGGKKHPHAAQLPETLELKAKPSEKKAAKAKAAAK